MYITILFNGKDFMGKFNFTELRSFYYDQIQTKIMPFWVKYAIDYEDGGIFTGISDDGKIQTTDKYIWSNARALYTFSALCNYIEKKKEWLDIAENIFRFLQKYGRDSNKTWGFLVDKKGKMLEGERSIQVDAFALMGLTEYIKATNSQEAIDMAQETYASVIGRLAKPGSYGTHPYPIPEGYSAHRDYFQFAFAFFEFGKQIGDIAITNAGLEKAETIMRFFRLADKKALVEYLGDDFRFKDTPEGRTMVPGHAIESMWFLIHIYRMTGNETRIKEAIETIRWSLESGWDSEYGGLFLGIDISGKEPVYWKNPTKKIWWVFVEALYASLLAYEISGDDWFLTTYQKIHDWAFSHFPVEKYGEWTQKLDRKGKPIDTIVALPVKDPFHLPRAFILCHEALKRLEHSWQGKKTNRQ
jgi:N-acylglucosamine 2-epimerase